MSRRPHGSRMALGAIRSPASGGCGAEPPAALRPQPCTLTRRVPAAPSPRQVDMRYGFFYDSYDTKYYFW